MAKRTGMDVLIAFLWWLAAALAVTMLATFTLAAGFACAHRPAHLAPAAGLAVPVPWCVWGEVKLDNRTVRVHVCTEDLPACEAGVGKARTPLGEIAGIRGVADCTFEP
jgi:hypothetical protein